MRTQEIDLGLGCAVPPQGADACLPIGNRDPLGLQRHVFGVY
jgi:hypothetical protein